MFNTLKMQVKCHKQEEKGTKNELEKRVENELGVQHEVH